MNTHDSGDIGETRVMWEAVKRGYTVSVPHGHNTRYDLIIDRANTLLRVQVKTVHSDGKIVKVLGRSVGKLDGKLITKPYSSSEIDAIVVYDVTTDRCAYIPIAAIQGKESLWLRLVPPANNQTTGINWFDDYLQW